MSIKKGELKESTKIQFQPPPPQHTCSHTLTLALKSYLKKTQDQVIELQITFQGSTIGQNLSARNTKSTTTLYARHSSEHFISI